MLHELLAQARRAFDAGSVGEAAELYETVLAKEPGSAEAAGGLGIALMRLGRYPQAASPLRKAIDLGTADGEVFVALGDCQFSMGQMEEAVRAFQRAASMEPNSARIRVKLAYSLIRLERAEEAEIELREAIEREPDFAAAHDMMAFLLPQMGRFEEARRSAQTAARLNPEQTTYGVRLIYSGKVRTEDEETVDRLRSAVRSGRLNERDRILAEFGLGKALEDLGEFEESSWHYVQANALSSSVMQKRNATFDPGAFKRDVDLIVRAFPDASVFERVRPGSESDAPVFVVGMMRSGSTLAEQILSSHPQIGGAGEVPFWIEHAPRLVYEIGARTFPNSIDATVRNYLAVLDGLCPGKERICDKLLQNYMALGALHAALPNARIVHCRRDSRDTCLSVFTTPFTYPPPFAYRADHIAFAYREYLRIMERWREILPSDRFLEVDYEALVTDAEPTARTMVEFLGLPWDDACLRPHENPRLVGNPSQWQVRQPLYTNSIGRWRRFEPWMKPQMEAWTIG